MFVDLPQPVSPRPTMNPIVDVDSSFNSIIWLAAIGLGMSIVAASMLEMGALLPYRYPLVSQFWLM